MESSVVSAVVVTVLCLLCPSSSASYSPYGKALRLSSVRSLTFSKEKDTTYRRSSPIKQLLCEKGCHLHDPDEVWCKNIQSIGKNVFWQCEANLPSHVSLKDPKVNCEGYDSSEDEDVLEGSCGLKYTLVETGSEKSSGYLRWLLLITILLVSLYAFSTTWNGRGT